MLSAPRYGLHLYGVAPLFGQLPGGYRTYRKKDCRHPPAARNFRKTTLLLPQEAVVQRILEPRIRCKSARSPLVPVHRKQFMKLSLSLMDFA